MGGIQFTYKLARLSLVLIMVNSMIVMPTHAMTANTLPKKLRIKSALTEFAVRQYNTIETLADFEKEILSRLKRSDRGPVLKLLKQYNKLPQLKRQGTHLIFSLGGESLKIEWSDVANPVFKINGQLWRYNERLPLSLQIELLKKRLGRSKVSALQNILMPRAEAAIAVGTLLLTVGISVVVTTLINKLSGGAIAVLCQSLIKTHGYSRDSPLISGLQCKLGKEKSENDVTMNAIKDQIAATNKSQNVLAKYKVRELQCPDNNDGKDRFYKAHITALEQKDGKFIQPPTAKELAKLPEKERIATRRAWQAKAHLVTVRMSSKGDPIEINIGKKNPEDASSKVVINNRFKFNSDGALESVSVPNTKPTDSLIEPKDLLAITRDSKKSPEQEAMWLGAKDLTKFLNFRITSCTVAKVEKKLERGGELVAPGAKDKKAVQ